MSSPENESAEVDSAANPADGDEVARLREELAQAQERALRTQAELENFRKRTRRELEDELKYANLPLIRDLLPVMDNIQRALEAGETTHDAEKLLEGVRLIAQQMQNVLTRFDSQPIEAHGQPFDPNLHQAIMQQPSDQPAGTVLTVAQAGYKLHDRVIRPAQVIVAAPPTDGRA